MDVRCTTCGEPWDTYHLWHDAIYDTGLTHEQAEIWNSLPRSEQLNDCYRQAFRSAGYQFGKTLVNVIHCPACPKDGKPDLGRFETKAALEDLLGNDEDGLAATFEDHHL